MADLRVINIGEVEFKVLEKPILVTERYEQYEVVSTHLQLKTLKFFITLLKEGFEAGFVTKKEMKRHKSVINIILDGKANEVTLQTNNVDKNTLNSLMGALSDSGS